MAVGSDAFTTCPSTRRAAGGIARKWWWYKQPPAVIGWTVNAFGAIDRPSPIEALLVWLAISFDAIFAYEFLKGITHDTRSVKATLFGS